jgi:hypothetical protein
MSSASNNNNRIELIYDNNSIQGKPTTKTFRQLQRQIELEQIRNIIKKGKESKKLQQSISQRQEKELKTDNTNTTITNYDNC